jgi:glycosyltransferase involved in cell wall biosynthesis
LAGSLTFVIPVFNEEGSLQQLAREIIAAMAHHQHDWRALFVDDGSTDRSWNLIQQITTDHPQFEGIRLRKRFGKSAALAAGFQQVNSDYVAMLDGDLQDDPAEIPAMLQLLNDKKLDLVSGWKKERHDPWHKVFPSRVFNAMVSYITGVKLHDHNCGLKLMRRAVTDEIQLYGERHRFIPVLAAARGFTVGEKVVRHRPREHGKSKYGVGRFFKGFLDLLTVRFLMSYEHRPQHLLGILGMIFAFIGLAGMGYLAIDWFRPGHTPLQQRPLLTYSVASLLLGVQFFSMGLLAELITAQRRRAEDCYSIAERTKQ